jgi:hypothetical protein
MATKKAKPAEKKSKGPRQKPLPGMEDRALQELEAKAEEYAEVRDERMSLTEQESELNAELLLLMKKYKKSEYHHGDVHCWVKYTEEKVKVKIGELKPEQKTKPATEAPQNKQTEFDPNKPPIAEEAAPEVPAEAEA